jgi:hypothetical protein
VTSEDRTDETAELANDDVEGHRKADDEDDVEGHRRPDYDPDFASRAPSRGVGASGEGDDVEGHIRRT